MRIQLPILIRLAAFGGIYDANDVAPRSRSNPHVTGGHCHFSARLGGACGDLFRVVVARDNLGNERIGDQTVRFSCNGIAGQTRT